jgi:hypothetical protein
MVTNLWQGTRYNKFDIVFKRYIFASCNSHEGNDFSMKTDNKYNNYVDTILNVTTRASATTSRLKSVHLL